jgi:hypothetical protein
VRWLAVSHRLECPPQGSLPWPLTIWIGEQQSHDCIYYPSAHRRRVDYVEVYQEWEYPYLTDASHKRQVAGKLGDVAYTDHCYYWSSVRISLFSNPYIDLLCKTVYGIVNKFDWNVSKPNPLRVRVRYSAGDIIGIWNVSPRMYSGLDDNQINTISRTSTALEQLTKGQSL